MICVECKNPVKNAFLQYKKDYITLQKCGRCHAVVDKYIEYDHVLLFLDIVLLKPQAYRHLCFNVTEQQMGGTSHSGPGAVGGRTSGTSHSTRGAVTRPVPGTISRLIIMIILFEVYLSWAYEEKKSHHSLLMASILHQPVVTQYLLFIIKLVLNLALFNLPLQLMFSYLNWNGSQINLNLPLEYQKLYHSRVLLTAVLIANSIRLLPILTLIWPYDNSVQLFNIVKFISVVNVIESLKVVSELGYLVIGVCFGVCYLIQQAGSVGVICLVVGQLGKGESVGRLFVEYFQHLFNY